MKQLLTTAEPTISSVSANYNSLKNRFMEDMELAGLAEGSMRAYLADVEQLQDYPICDSVPVHPNAWQRLPSFQKIKSQKQKRLQ